MLLNQLKQLIFLASCSTNQEMFPIRSKLCSVFDGSMRILLYMKVSLDCMRWKKTDADSIVGIIKDSLLRFGFDKKKLRGQCYDGCSTMMGKKTGVSKQIKDDVQPLALSTNCYAHSLNLACGDWMKSSSVVSKSLATSYEITKLLNFHQNETLTYEKFTRKNTMMMMNITTC